MHDQNREGEAPAEPCAMAKHPHPEPARQEPRPPGLTTARRGNIFADTGMRGLSAPARDSTTLDRDKEAIWTAHGEIC
jgi:hypothetical protein